MATKLYSLGAAEEVTGSKHILQHDQTRIMIDCGAFQGRREEAEKKNRDWSLDNSGLESVVLTHAHFDHCGLIPLLHQKGYEGNVYCTSATRDLASLIMMDSAHIQAKDIEFLEKKARKKGLSFDKKPLYVENDVLTCLDSFVTCSYHRDLPVADGIKVTFYDAGHIMGSALPVFEITQDTPDPLRICIGGDLGRQNLPIIRNPEPLPPLDYLVVESTYGNRLHDNINLSTEKLAEVVNRTYQRGGKIIIPSFALERTQEIVFYLHLLVDQQRIPKMPIYVDSPMATNATSIFQVHQECFNETTRQAFIDHHKNPFGFNELHYVTSVEESKSLNDIHDPIIIISSSGMCEAGRILHHLANTIQNPKNTILIVGYMAENTLGRKILEKQPQVKIFDEIYKLKSEVVVLNTFSAHADYEDILNYIQPQDKKRLKQIFLIHGEPNSQKNLKHLLQEQGYPTTIIQYNQVYDL